MIAIVILAAGKSSRLGSKKQLLSWKKSTLLETSIVAAQGTDYSPIMAIVPQDNEIINTIQHHDIVVIPNLQREQGVSTSIKLGTQHIINNSPQTKAAIFMVCDQPFITSQILCELGEKYKRGCDIVTCSYGGTWGIPTLFSRKYFSEILELSGDKGAKKLLQRHKDLCATIEFPQGNADIDTMEDYGKYKNQD
ncbi:NTP transferase domain-containing protein [Candidatus Uabimicrobium sp. HlEnr_7]|uniref:nucleotidyltransferase family protein n=1 Tax=Candidatus Uabimicrobium helgolandensis TaxID=3095367 RepID=UPI00355877B5